MFKKIKKTRKMFLTFVWLCFLFFQNVYSKDLQFEPFQIELSQDDVLDVFDEEEESESIMSSGNYKTGKINLIGDNEVKSVVVYKSEKLMKLEEESLKRELEFQRKLDAIRREELLDEEE